MAAISRMIEWFNQLSEYFYEIYLDVLYWVIPFSYIAIWFYWLSDISNKIAWELYYFYDWVASTESRVRDIIDWPFIWEHIKLYVPNIEALGDWFAYWWIWVDQRITIWWASTNQIVSAWIDQVRQWAWSLIVDLQRQVNDLGAWISNILDQFPDISAIIAWFSNWTGNVSSVISTWWIGALSEIQDLINSAFIIRSDFWQGWQDWRDKVIEFFTDPEDWLYKSVDRIIERFW